MKQEIIFCLSGTGNSLYAAKMLGTEICGIAREIKKENRHYSAERIGIVCPTYEFDVPEIVKEFIRTSTFETEYLYVIATYGMHHGGLAERLDAFMKECGRPAAYINTVLMADNALPVFNMDDQRDTNVSKHVDEQLSAIAADIAEGKHFIQPSPKEETDFYLGYLKHPLGFTWSDDNPLYAVSDACIGCGICARICPMKCIEMKDGHPEHSYGACLMCLACIQACPKKAIRFASIHEQNPEARYRNENITLNDLFKLNQ